MYSLLLPCLSGDRWGQAHALPMPPLTEAAAPMTAPLRTPSGASSTLASTLLSTLWLPHVPVRLLTLTLPPPAMLETLLLSSQPTSLEPSLRTSTWDCSNRTSVRRLAVEKKASGVSPADGRGNKPAGARGGGKGAEGIRIWGRRTANGWRNKPAVTRGEGREGGRGNEES